MKEREKFFIIAGIYDTLDDPFMKFCVEAFCEVAVIATESDCIIANASKTLSNPVRIKVKYSQIA